jgi:hypothetical protein
MARGHVFDANHSLFRNVLKKFLTGEVHGENNMATTARRTAMIAEVIAIARRSRDTLIADAGGVGLLFLLLVGGLHLTAL